MLKRPVVILLVMFGIAGAVGLVRTHFRRRQLTENAKSVEPAEMAAKFHTGAPPCLRYLPSLEGAPEAEFEETAKRLDAVELSSDQLADVIGHFITEHTSRETSAHAAPSVDEYLEQLEAQQVDPLSKVAFWVQRGLLRSKLSKMVDGANDTLRNLETEGAVVWASLTPAQRVTLQTIDAEHPQHLEVSGVLRFLPALKRLTTHRRAKAIVALAREVKLKRPEFPVRLEDLSLPDPKRVDGWGNAFVLSAATDVIEVRSPGADDASPEDDIIETSNGPVEPKAPAALSARAEGCSMPGTEAVIIKRSDFVDGEALARGVRVVPVFVDGAARGFKVFGIRAGSEAERVGLCNGDVLQALNGMPLSSPEKVIEAYDATMKRGSAALTIERRGVTGVLNVELRD